MNNKTRNIQAENKEIIDNIKDVCSISGVNIDYILIVAGVSEDKRKQYISCREQLPGKVAFKLAKLLNVPTEMFVRQKPEFNEKEQINDPVVD